MELKNLEPPPVMSRYDSAILIAFNRLSTCRREPLRPIPWTAIDQYARRYGIRGDEWGDFMNQIYELDGFYLKHESERVKLQQRNAAMQAQAKARR